MGKLTLRKRIELIEYHEKNGGTLLATARKYDVTISTVHKILKNKSVVVKRYNNVKDGRAKRFSLSENAVIDFEVAKWYMEQQGVKNFKGVTKWELRKIANTVAKEYKIDFTLTSDWIKEFVKRNGVILKVVSKNKGELNSAKAKGSPKKIRIGKGIVNYILKRKSVTRSLKLDNEEKTDGELLSENNKRLQEVATNNGSFVNSANILIKDAEFAKSSSLVEQDKCKNSQTENAVNGIKDIFKIATTENSKLDQVNGNLPQIAQFNSKKGQGTMQVSPNLIEKMDNLKDSTKLVQINKNKLSYPKSIKSTSRAVRNTTKLFSNLNGVRKKEVKNLKTKEKPQAKRVNKNEVNSSKRLKLMCTNESNTLTSVKPTNDIGSTEVDQIKEDKLNHLKNIGLRPRIDMGLVQVPSNFSDVNNDTKCKKYTRQSLVKTEVDLSTTNKLSPEGNQSTTQELSNRSTTPIDVKNNTKTSHSVKKRLTSNRNEKTKVSYPRKNCLRPRKGHGVTQTVPKLSSDIVIEERGNLKASNTIKDVSIANKLITQDPCETTTELANEKTVLKVENKKLKIAKVTLKKRWQIKKTLNVKKGDQKKERKNLKKNTRSDKIKESEKCSIKKENINNNYKTFLTEENSIIDSKTDDKKKDIFEFNVEVEDAALLPKNTTSIKEKKLISAELNNKASDSKSVIQNVINLNNSSSNSPSSFSVKNNTQKNHANDSRLNGSKVNDLKPSSNKKIRGKTNSGSQCEEKSVHKRRTRSTYMSPDKNNHANIVVSQDLANEITEDPRKPIESMERKSCIEKVNLKEETSNTKASLIGNVSLEFTPKKPRVKSNSSLKSGSIFHRSRRRSLRINGQNNITNPNEIQEDSIKLQKLTDRRNSNNLHENGMSTDNVKDVNLKIESKEVNKETDDIDSQNICGSHEPTSYVDNDDTFNYSFEYQNLETPAPEYEDDVDFDETDYCVAIEDGDVVEITCADNLVEMPLVTEAPKAKPEDIKSAPKIDIISDIQIISGSKNIIKEYRSRFNRPSKYCNTSEESSEKTFKTPRTIETRASKSPSPKTRNNRSLDDTWSNLFSELDSDLSADELVNKINEIEFPYDPDPFKDVKIKVIGNYKGEDQYDESDYENVPSSQGQPMPPPNQMQQPPNNMQNNYRPPMPPNGRAPAPRGPQPNAPRMPGGPRGPQMNQRAPGARPRAPMVGPRGAGAQPVGGQVRPRMAGTQNGIRPTNQTSPTKRTPDQNAALQAKRKKLDVLTPSDKDDDDCQVICMQPKNTDGGLPQIESVQGATTDSVENSIMHLSDSITLSVRNPPPKPVASPVKSDAKAVANILATRGITVTASAKSKESHSPVKQASPMPTALSLNGAVSIVASKNGAAKPAVSENLPTVDLTDDSAPPKDTSSPTKNRPGLPYRCDLCPAQYPNAMGLNKHRQTYHKTSSGMCELGVPLINIKQPGIMQKLSQLGINNYIPLPSAGPEGTYALPIISTKSPGNVAALGATQMLSLGPVRTIPRPGVTNANNAAKK